MSQRAWQLYGFGAALVIGGLWLAWWVVDTLKEDWVS